MEAPSVDNKCVDLKKLEDVFRIVGVQEGKAALQRRVLDYYMVHDHRVKAFLEEMMAKYANPRLEGAPASDNNLSKEKKDLNYFAPKKNLQEMLCGTWFDKVCTDKKTFTTQWREDMIAELMLSDHRHEIAEKWAQADQRTQIKGHVIGALARAGILKGKNLALARTFLNIDENTKEVKTLAKYMGDSIRANYADWIVDYVSQSKNG